MKETGGCRGMPPDSALAPGIFSPLLAYLLAYAAG